jgi:hypothetical protein
MSSIPHTVGEAGREVGKERREEEGEGERGRI